MEGHLWNDSSKKSWKWQVSLILALRGAPMADLHVKTEAEFEPPGLAKIFCSDIQSVTLNYHTPRRMERSILLNTPLMEATLWKVLVSTCPAKQLLSPRNSAALFFVPYFTISCKEQIQIWTWWFITKNMPQTILALTPPKSRRWPFERTHTPKRTMPKHGRQFSWFASLR